MREPHSAQTYSEALQANDLALDLVQKVTFATREARVVRRQLRLALGGLGPALHYSRAHAHDESEVSSSGTPGGSAAAVIIVRQRLPSSSTAVTSCFDRPENSRRYLRLVLVNFYTTPW